MNEPVEWNDLCRKTFASAEAARAALDPCLRIMKDVATAVLNKKLEQGYEVVTPLKPSRVWLIEVLQSEAQPVTGAGTSAVFIEAVHRCTIRKTA